MHNSKSLFQKLVSIQHVFLSWEQFVVGKRKRKDIQVFSRNLEDRLFHLQEELQQQTYRHGPYHKFYVYEPKKRFISKAFVRDRCVHHMLHNMLSAIYEPRFFYHSYSCRKGKGVHAGVKAFIHMLTKASSNKRNPVFSLKLDIKQFFDSVDHTFLMSLLKRHIYDSNVLSLLQHVIDSFHTYGKPNKGLPLGNVTSQIFANIYLHELDFYIKHTLKEQYYIRYCDDFIILSQDEAHLKELISKIDAFLKEQLFLRIHPQKIILRKWSMGVDFLGYICFPHFKLLRKKTKNRLCRRLSAVYEKFLRGDCEMESLDQSLQSYLGMLGHANGHEFSQILKNAYSLR